MADFTGKVNGSMIKAPVDDDPGAQPRPHRQENHMVAALTRAEAVLGDRPGVGVILHPADGSKLRLHDRFHRNIDPGAQVGWRLNNASQPIQWPTAANPYGRNTGCVQAPLGKQLVNSSLNELNRRSRALCGPRRKLDAPERIRRLFGNDDGSLGAADVNTYQHLVSHKKPSPELARFSWRLQCPPTFAACPPALEFIEM
jgi:hypothetical protein